MTVFNAVLPIVTLILGFLGSLLLEGRRDRRALEREAVAREAQRVEQDRRDRLSFERQALIDTHAAIRALVEEVHTLIPLFAAAERSNQGWHEYPGGEEAKQRVMAANVRRGHVATLILNRPAFEAVDRVGTSALPLYMKGDALRSEELRGDFYTAVDSAFRAIADRLQLLYSVIGDARASSDPSEPDGTEEESAT